MLCTMISSPGPTVSFGLPENVFSYSLFTKRVNLWLQTLEREVMKRGKIYIMIEAITACERI